MDTNFSEIAVSKTLFQEITIYKVRSACHVVSMNSLRHK